MTKNFNKHKRKLSIALAISLILGQIPVVSVYGQANNDFENALVVWFHRRIYDLLKSESKEDFEKNATCLIYNNGNCPYISKYKTDKSYDCKTAPWLVVKGEKQAMCPYAVAAHSLGLWQNDLDINF